MRQPVFFYKQLTNRPRNEDGKRYFDKQTLILVELQKFYENSYNADNSPLAQWLRAIEFVNNENEGALAGTPYVEVLQKFAKLSNFSIDFFLSEAKDMVDREYELSIERREARKEGLAEGRAEGQNATLEAMRKLGVPEEKIREAEALLKSGAAV